MKAKMTDKPPETGKYLCNKCSTTFVFTSGVLACPVCHDHTDTVLIGVKDNPTEEQMYTKDDWHGG